MSDINSGLIAVIIIFLGGLIMIKLAINWTGSSLFEILMYWDPRNIDNQQKKFLSVSPKKQDSTVADSFVKTIPVSVTGKNIFDEYRKMFYENVKDDLTLSDQKLSNFSSSFTEDRAEFKYQQIFNDIRRKTSRIKQPVTYQSISKETRLLTKRSPINPKQQEDMIEKDPKKSTQLIGGISSSYH